MNRKQRAWLSLAVFAGFAAMGFAIYYYRATQEFEIAGELLYKNEASDQINDVKPVAGAEVEVFEDKGKVLSSRYQILLIRQINLKDFQPGPDNAKLDTYFAPLSLVPLSKIDSWSWWEGERLGNCFWAPQLLKETLQSPAVYATSTNMSGHFWLKLKRGKYFITASSKVPSFFRRADKAFHPMDTSAPLTGDAFWNIPIVVSGNMKVVLAKPDCSP